MSNLGIGRRIGLYFIVACWLIVVIRFNFDEDLGWWFFLEERRKKVMMGEGYRRFGFFFDLDIYMSVLYCFKYFSRGVFMKF